MPRGAPLTRMFSLRVTDAVWKFLRRRCAAESKRVGKRLDLAAYLREVWERERLEAEAAAVTEEERRVNP